MVLVQKWPFFLLFRLVNIRKEKVFYDILERENAFLGYKNKKFKSWKIDIFPKGVNPWFWPKNRHFSNFSFSDNIALQNVFYDILRRKNAFRGYKNKKFKKLKNLHISKGINPCFWSKMDIFPKGLTHGFGINMAIFHVSSFGNIGQGNVIYHILEQKKTFLGYKNKKFKKSKNWHISKRVNPWFWSKNGHFLTLFLGNIGQENVFYEILEQKNAFLSWKKKRSKKSKNWHFSKGVNP